MQDKEFESRNQKYQYQMLDRLKSDCDYYLGHGNRHSQALWAGNEEGQIAKMKEIWNNLEEKPEWLTWEDINEYAVKMGVIELPSTRNNTAKQEIQDMLDRNYEKEKKVGFENKEIITEGHLVTNEHGEQFYLITTEEEFNKAWDIASKYKCMPVVSQDLLFEINKKKEKQLKCDYCGKSISKKEYNLFGPMCFKCHEKGLNLVENKDILDKECDISIKEYNKFCKDYDIDPNDYDDVLFTIDELEGQFGDEDGKLQQIRTYVVDKINKPEELKLNEAEIIADDNTDLEREKEELQKQLDDVEELANMKKELDDKVNELFEENKNLNIENNSKNNITKIEFPSSEKTATKLAYSDIKEVYDTKEKFKNIFTNAQLKWLILNGFDIGELYEGLKEILSTFKNEVFKNVISIDEYIKELNN